jgi:glycosyltransferase involved in cell wall biosynthesis
VLLLTYNEQDNLPMCLKALEWCDDIICVDSGSTDNGVALLQAAGVRVLHRPFDNFAAQRNFGLYEGQPKHDWVLHLDADEVVTDEFRDAIMNMTPEESIYAYRVPSKLMLAGQWLRHSGMYPTYQVRLGRVGHLRFKQVGHGQQEDLPGDQLGTFDIPYLHFNFSKGLESWFIKHVAYARDEANRIISAPEVFEKISEPSTAADPTARRRRLKYLSGKLPPLTKPFARFIYIYVLRSGWKDGRAGLLYATMMAIYEAMIAVFQIHQSSSKPPRDS